LSIDALQIALEDQPQALSDDNVFHHFADGLYCRELAVKAGIALVGKVHNYEHIFTLTLGTVLIADEEDGRKAITAPYTFVSKAGARRVILALEDSLLMTVHRTDLETVEQVEAELVSNPLEHLTAHDRALLELSE